MSFYKKFLNEYLKNKKVPTRSGLFYFIDLTINYFFFLAAFFLVVFFLAAFFFAFFAIALKILVKHNVKVTIHFELAKI